MPTMYWPAEQEVVVVRVPLGTCSNVVQLMSSTRHLLMHSGIGTQLERQGVRSRFPTCAARRARHLPQQAPTGLSVSCGQGADAIPQGREAREDGV